MIAPSTSFDAAGKIFARRIFISSAIKLSTKSGTGSSAGIYNCILIALSQPHVVVFLGNKRKGPKGRRSLNESSLCLCCALEHSFFCACTHHTAAMLLEMLKLSRKGNAKEPFMVIGSEQRCFNHSFNWLVKRRSLKWQKKCRKRPLKRARSRTFLIKSRRKAHIVQ